MVKILSTRILDAATLRNNLGTKTLGVILSDRESIITIYALDGAQYPLGIHVYLRMFVFGSVINSYGRGN